jgi:iron complex outermembrane receptor protein
MSATHHRALFLAASVVALGSAAQAQVAGAGGAPPLTVGGEAPAQISEVVVTAQKRSERLLDVPLSVTAATGAQMQKQGVDSVADLEKIAPGFTFRESQYGTPVFSIRGIGFYSEQVAVAPTVTVYTDQAPIPYARMTEGVSLDLERVEVLKGPQGTLFGQNSTGGAVNYIAAKPTADFASGVDAGYGRFNTVSLGGFLSGPVSDTLGVRVAARAERRDGWQQSITRDEANGRRRFATARLLVDWRPTDSLFVELNLNGWINRSELQVGQPRGYLPVNPAPPTTVVTTAVATALAAYPYPTSNKNRLADWDPGFSRRRDDHFGQAVARIEYQLNESTTLIAISAYSHLKSLSPIDIDATSVNSNQIRQFGKIDTFSQELRVEGDIGDRWKWVVGGNYQNDRNSDFQTVRLQGSNSELIGIHFDGLDLINRQKVRDLAAFGGLDYKLTDTVTLQGSLRYTDERRDFEGCMSDTGGPIGFRIPLNMVGLNITPGGCITLLPNGQSGLHTASLDQDSLSWRAAANYKPSRDTLLYVSAAKGYKAGTFGTLPGVTFQQYSPVTQESVVAYEAGFKTRASELNADFTLALFYNDYSNKQIQGYLVVPPFGNLPNLVNVPKSRLYGAEASLTFQPIEGLRLTAAGSYVDSEVTDDAIVSSPFGDQINAKGEAFPASPRWQLQADAEYSFPLGEGLKGYVGANASWRSATTAAFGARSGPAGTQGFFAIKGYGLLDLRGGLEVGERYRFQVWGSNVTGTNYWNNATHVYDTYVRFTGMPTTYGVTASARF